MQRLQHSLAYIEATVRPDLGASYQQKHALELLPLREHGGQKSGSRRLFQLRSPANGRSQDRLVARWQRLNGRDGRRSRGRRKRPEADESRLCSGQINPIPSRNKKDTLAKREFPGSVVGEDLRMRELGNARS